MAEAKVAKIAVSAGLFNQFGNRGIKHHNNQTSLKKFFLKSYLQYSAVIIEENSFAALFASSFIMI